MEKRVVLFLILSLLIIVGYDYLLKELGWLPPTPGAEKNRPAEQTVAQPVNSEGRREPTSEPSAPGTPVPSRPAVVRSPEPVTAQVSSNAELVTVSTPLIRATFTTRGASIQSWDLQRYTAKSQDGIKPVQLVYSGRSFQAPLTLSLLAQSSGNDLASALYEVDRDFDVLDARHPVGHLTFRYRDPQKGVSVEKRLTFHHDSYLVDVHLTVDGASGAVDIGLGTNFGIVEWGEGFIGLLGAAMSVDGKVEKEMPEAMLERKSGVRWVALQDKYFLSVLVPSQPAAAVVKKEGDKLVSAALRLEAPAGKGPIAFQLYAGPKEFDTLKALNVGLEDTIDFGWFIFGSWSVVKTVAKPLFYVLRFFYDFTHNYGVSIILLTCSIKLLFIPLQYKSYKSMKQMQTIQPQVAALQTKYKDDRDRLNKELIKLYRDKRVNPVGGCLPMVLQMPVFVALFNILYMTIDLRQAPFVLWITDLSVADPYYALPLVMGVTMVIQQKITPTTMDPTQAKIMLVLPAFMTFLFITFPAGLVLYWLTNNVLTIAQQIITERYVAWRGIGRDVASGAEASAS
jgi:YidC/Oxa1 family membrane protein insertase